MAIFISSSFSINPMPRPNHEIDVRDKNSQWILDNAKYIYGQYISGQCAITEDDVRRIQLLRSYVDGKQDYSVYKKRYLSESKNMRKHEYGHIDWQNIYSPMPKLVDKVLGLFLSQEHNTVATCVSEMAKEYKISKLAETYAINKLQDSRMLFNKLVGVSNEQDPLLNPMLGFIANDMNEIEMLTSSGSTKIPYETASEKAIDETEKLSNYKHIKRNAVKDLICGYIAMREVVDNDKVIWQNVDITDVIIEYSRNNHFNKSRYFGIQELWTIEDLRRKGYHEDELKKIANTYYNYNMNIRGLSERNRPFQTYDVYYRATNSYGYDEFVVPVLYIAFKSNDIKYLKKVKIRNGEERVYPSDFGKLTKDTVVKSTEMIYEGRWIIGTDNIFDDGVMAYIPRDSAGMVSLPCYVAHLTGASIVERCKHTLDEFAMLGYKLQAALARSQGKQPAIDFSSLEEITSNSGGKLTPLDILDMYYQGAGVPYRSLPVDANVNYSRPKPVEELAGGIGNYLNELLILREAYYKELSDLTGVSTFEVPQSQTPVGIARLAVANMTDVLKPLYDVYLEVKERLSYNTVYRIQMLLHDYDNKKKDTPAFTFYKNCLGLHYAEYLRMAYKTEPMDIGIKFEALPNGEMKAAVMAAAERALQTGKNGTPLITMSEYLYIVNNINSYSGLKEARMMLQYREQQDEIKANQRQMQAIQAQGEAIKQQIAMKGAMDENKVKAQLGADLTTTKAKADLELRNEKALRGDEQVYNAVNRGVDFGMQQQQTAYDNPMTQQMQQQNHLPCFLAQ